MQQATDISMIKFLTEAQLSKLSAPELKALHDALKQEISSLGGMKKKLEGVIIEKYAKQEAKAREEKGSEFGAVNVKIGDITFKITRAKAIDYDQKKLANIKDKIDEEIWNALVTERRSVSEVVLHEHPAAIRRRFEAARTVKAKAPTLAIQQDEIVDKAA